MADVAEIAMGLDPHDEQQLLTAGLADSHEWWVSEPLIDTRLAPDDGVLTPLGLAVRDYLMQEKYR